MSVESRQVRLNLRHRVTCPHCWHTFPPEEVLWIASHPDLQRDPRFSDAAGQRFLPTRFNVDGNAIDPGGTVCRELACPNCHLPVPRALLEMSPFFASIAGTPSCGKTYFLASMTWQLRQNLPRHFAMTFSDADPASNIILNEYEHRQFFSDTPDQPVKLDKTEQEGHLYETVLFGEQPVTYPRPFLFVMQPGEKHSNHGNVGKYSRVLCLYDNAGESYDPGSRTENATRHLARAQVLMFCFDPTQDPRVREDCRKWSTDPQVVAGLETRRQEVVLHEMINRVRKHAGLGQSEKHTRPLIVIVTKYDIWSPLIDQDRLDPPWVASRNGSVSGLDLPQIERLSQQVRAMLWKYSPDLVAAAEAFSHRVFYVPVSATGCSPEAEPNSPSDKPKLGGIRPKDIKPMWVEVPLLLTLACFTGGMIPYINPKRP